MTVFDECGPTISADHISALEDILQADLPSGYRQFLLTNNGGRPDPDIVDVKGAPGTPTDVQVFFGIGRAIESSDIAWNLALMADRCPSHHVLPIACDSGGNLFCLEVEAGIASRVVYCDLDSPGCAVYTVAPSFEVFLEMLRTPG